MKVSEGDFIYGSRSGIQKAIRRGDLNLALTCFDALWASKDHRQWLKWRTPILVMEDAWQMAGELGEFLASYPGEDEAAWRKFFLRLTIASKNREPSALWLLAEKADDLEAPEVEVMRYWQQEIVHDDPSSVVDKVEEYCFKGPSGMPLTDYEKAGITAFGRRVSQGGMLFDRKVLLTSMLLVALRGISKPEIRGDLKRGADLWKKRSGLTAPKKVELPWYVFDMHTQAGKIGMGIFMRHKAEKYPGLDKDLLGRLWFEYASAKSHPDLMHWVRLTDKPRCFDSMWRVEQLRRWCVFGDHNAKETKKIWDTQMEKDIRGSVEWILGKRAEAEKA